MISLDEGGRKLKAEDLLINPEERECADGNFIHK
jgi:hypothetical protein